MPVNRRHWQSFAMAFGLESLLIVGTLTWAGQHIAPMTRDVIPLTLETAAAPLVEKKQLPAELPKINHPPKTSVIHNAPSASLSPPKVQAVSNDPPQQLPTKSESTTSATPSTQTPSIAAPAAQATPDPTLAYNVKLAAAVQAAFDVPGSAKALSFKGRARMEFSLHDGKVSAIRVLQSSGLSAVDRAAIKAVESASYPAPPAALQNKEGVYQIWVACY